MLIAQRTRELGLLRALGADRRQVRRSVLTEALLLGLVGSTLGLAAGIGLALGLIKLMSAFGMNLKSDRDGDRLGDARRRRTRSGSASPSWRRISRPGARPGVSPMAALADAEDRRCGAAVAGARGGRERSSARRGPPRSPGVPRPRRPATAASLLGLGVVLTLHRHGDRGPACSYGR